MMLIPPQNGGKITHHGEVQPRTQGLSSLPPLVVGTETPGCGWSRDHPESGW